MSNSNVSSKSVKVGVQRGCSYARGGVGGGVGVRQAQAEKGKRAGEWAEGGWGDPCNEKGGYMMKVALKRRGRFSSSFVVPGGPKRFLFRSGSAAGPDYRRQVDHGQWVGMAAGRAAFSLN
eukprot:756512-Hanusia_phi.AAC.2